MSLNARKVESGGGKKHPIMDPGTYSARLVQVIDLGLQKQRPFKGQDKDPANEIMLTYEFVDEFLLDEDGNEMTDKPRWLSEQLPFHNLDVDRANSTKRYYALDPEEKHKGDFAALIGTPVMVTVVHSKPSAKGVVYNNIAAVSSMTAKMAAKTEELVNPPKILSLDEPDTEIFLSLPDWIQDKIKDGLEFEGSKLDKALSNNNKADQEDLDDEIPFDEGAEESQEDQAEDETESKDEDW